MKVSKSLLAIILLLTINSMVPKALRRTEGTPPTIQTTIPTPMPIPIKQSIMQQPIIAQPKTYAQALHAIRTMAPNTVLINNVFTQEFITFVISLNLSPLETKALLEAGANLHAVWNDNNEINKKTVLSLHNSIAGLSPSKPVEQKKPITQRPVEQQRKETKQYPRKQQKAPLAQKTMGQTTQKTVPHSATNSLIMLLDPENVEQIGNDRRAMVQDALIDLYEQAAPIIMTSNILEIITSIRQQIGENNFQQLRAQPYNNIIPFAEQLVKQYSIHEASLHLILLSLINFDTTNFTCYFHKSSNIVLIIPQLYLNKNLPYAHNLNANDKATACGFNPNVLTHINNLTTDNLLQQLTPMQSRSKRQEKIIADLTSLFIPQKKNGEILSLQDSTQWVIYLSGHGGPAYQAMGNIRGPLTQIARVAGLTTNNFHQLMKFFDTTINTAFLHYTTCFSGGYNQTFVNEVLSSLDVNFIVSSEGLGERKTSGISLQMRFSSQAPRISLGQYPFTDFFRLLNLFVSKPEEFVKIKEEKKDPIAVILGTIHANMTEENQPFVRFPGVGVFGALSINQKTKVLTQTIVKAHEIEQKAIDVSNEDVIIVYPSRINVPLKLGTINKNEHRAIVSPAAKSLSQYHETIHIFKELNCHSSIQSLLFTFVYLNTSMQTQTFIVKKLTGIRMKNNQTSTLDNLIIQINKQSMQLGQLNAHVEVAFAVNGTMYQSTITIRNFENSNALSSIFEKATFTAQPEKTADMNLIANRFLTQQEITTIKKPISLHSIVERIDSKIDQQTPSIFKQPDEDREALREFLKREKK